MAKRKPAAKQNSTKPSAAARKKGSPRGNLAKQAVKRTKIVYDEWESYVATRDGTMMFISFDDLLTRETPAAALRYCARIVLPIHAPNESGGPTSPESERLYALEDELCALLRKHKVNCRLIARLTYGGWREIVFQVQTWKTFRAPVGLWMMKNNDYAIEVMEHDGWEFFDEYIRPTAEDQLFMADRNVIDLLVESGSNPKRKHTLDYAFQGDSRGLKRMVQALLKRGYKALGKLDCDSGQIELTTRLPLDLSVVTSESVANYRLAEKFGIEMLGWGAAVVH